MDVFSGRRCRSPRADRFFGLFGSDQPPAPRPDAVSYAVEFVTPDAALKDALQSASNLYRLRQQPPESGEGLARRASADLPRLVDALWAEGYYDASARAVIDDQIIEMGGAGLNSAARAANADRESGSCRSGSRSARDALPHRRDPRRRRPHRRPVDPDSTQKRVLKLASGDPARANSIRDMQARLADAYREKSYPLVKVDLAEAVVRHESQTVDLLVKVDSGPKAGFGEVTIAGTRDLDPRVPARAGRGGGRRQHVGRRRRAMGILSLRALSVSLAPARIPARLRAARPRA